MARTAFSADTGVERLRGVALVALVLLPLLIGGLLSWGLATPTQNLDRVTAAVVNDDKPVTVNGKTVPLGRQFAAGLIAGSATSDQQKDTPNNFTWILTNDDEAKSGLASGRYAAVVTIPADFSAKATSISGPAADATQALLKVQTSAAATFIDPALTEAVTQTATASLNRQLTAQYLTNIYGGFNSINQQIGQAATGAASVASGASSLSAGANSLAAGTATLASGAASLDSGAASLSAGLDTLSAQSQGLPAQTAQLAAGTTGIATATDDASAAVSSATASMQAVVTQACQTPGALCRAATAALGKLQSADGKVSKLSGVADQVATGNQQLAAAMPQLVGGIDQSAAGAAQVAAGAAQTAAGAASVNSGAASVASGATQVDSGAAQLSDGLDQAVQKIPTYTDSDITTLSTVVSQPVLTEQHAPAPGSQSVPLFAVFALWVGGIVLALARKAVPERELLTTVSSFALTMRSLGTDVVLGLCQGVVVAAVASFALGLDPAGWLTFAALAALAGAAFAVVNRGLAAASGAVGRLIAVCVAVIGLAVGLASTVPPAFVGLAAFFPTTSALEMLRAVPAGDPGGVWAGIGGCLLFAVLGVALVFAGVAARRGMRLSDLRPLRPALR